MCRKKGRTEWAWECNPISDLGFQISDLGFQISDLRSQIRASFGSPHSFLLSIPFKSEIIRTYFKIQNLKSHAAILTPQAAPICKAKDREHHDGPNYRRDKARDIVADVVKGTDHRIAQKVSADKPADDGSENAQDRRQDHTAAITARQYKLRQIPRQKSQY